MSEARLGKYRILEEIGRGGFATVYRAIDTTLDREVALKILHPQLLVDRSFVERFGREARALASLRHPAIVTLFEIAEAEGRLFIAMELARGPNLAQLITKGGPMPWRAALGLLKPVCEALEYAHNQGVIHRDLKPTNILLDEERGALLSDFGFARLMSSSSVSLSLSGGVLGTPPYIAPEVWEYNAAEASADIYALGCIVYEMLTGQVLFGGETPMQALRAHDRGPQFPENWPEGVPDGLEAVLTKALARAPGERYASVRALWHALNDTGAQAQASREEKERMALAAQWRAEAERAIAAGEWGVARMTVGRWLTALPDDPEARAALARIEELQASERLAEAPAARPEPSRTPVQRPRPGVAEAKPPPAERDVSAGPAGRISPTRPKGGGWLPIWGWVLAGLAVVVLVIILIIGTNGQEKEVEPTATSTAAAEPTEPPTPPGADKQGGTLVLGFYQEPELLNSLIRTQTVASWAGGFLESSLLNVNPDGTYYAQLAKEVPTIQNGGLSKDGLTITLYLHEGRLWEDGDEFTCDDVVFTWESIVYPENDVWIATVWEEVESIECLDDYTVVVKFSQFYAPYLAMLTQSVLPSHLGLDPADMQNWEFNRKPLSLGPYKLEEWVSGDHMTLVRNENYWLWETEGKPYVDKVVMRWIDSREVGKQLIQTGELDFVWDLTEADIHEAQTWEGVVVKNTPSLSTERLVLNLADPELDAPCADFLRENPSPHWALGDSRVRKAIELAIDKQAIVDELLYGLTTVGTTEYNLGWSAPDIPESAYDPEKAFALLDEAGWIDTDGDGVRECSGCATAEGGRVLKLKIQANSGNELREQAEQVISEMMQEIGIELFIENVPTSELFGSYSGGAFRMHGQFDILMYTASGGMDPHSQMEGYFASYRIPCDDNGGTGFNYSRWVSDEYDEQMAIAGSSHDLEARKAAYKRAAEFIAEARPHIYLYDRADIDLLRDHFKGYVANIWTSTGSWNAEEWYIEE